LDLYDQAGSVMRVLGGPAATYEAVLAQIAVLPAVSASAGPG